MKRKSSICIFLCFILLLTTSNISAIAENNFRIFDIAKPSLRVFLPEPEVATGRTVIICPGGGYQHLAVAHEGYDWAPYFNKQGIAVIVLKYNMPEGDYTIPINDAKSALKLAHDSASVWNLNPNDIGIMGFSAGGHLASVIATQAEIEIRPAFQILFYPVITMNKTYTHIGSHDNFLGQEASTELETMYSSENQVNDETPRAFIALSNDDTIVSALNSINYYIALLKHHVPVSLHVYPSGGHGWGFKDNFKYKSNMLEELTAWLNSFDAPSKDAVRVACIGNSITYGHGIKERTHDSYPAVLGRLLGKGYNVRNFGMCGTTLLNKGDFPYCEQQVFKDALAFNPGIVIIKLGTNDSKSFNWKYKSDFKKDLQSLIDTLYTLPARPKIFLCYPAKVYQTGNRINDSIIFNEIIPKIKDVANYNNLPIIDLHSATDKIPDLFPDNIHPNEEGAALLAKIIYDALMKQ